MDSRNFTYHNRGLLKSYWKVSIEDTYKMFDVWQNNLLKWIGPFYSYTQAVSYCNSVNGTNLQPKKEDDNA